jgi:hypothetical protein
MMAAAVTWRLFAGLRLLQRLGGFQAAQTIRFMPHDGTMIRHAPHSGYGNGDFSWRAWRDRAALNMWWKDSATRESWARPPMPTPADDKTWYASSYYRRHYKIEKPVCLDF